MIRRGAEHLPRIIHSLDELPEPVRQTYEALPPMPLRQNIIIPPQDYYFATRSWREKLTITRRRTPQRTLFFSAAQIVIVEETEPLQTLVIPFVDILALELTTVLLYSALDLVWQQEGQVKTIQIEFNSVGAQMIGEELIQARAFIKSQNDLPLTGSHTEAAIKALPLKFTNYTRMSLLGEEKVWHVTYEPAIRQEGPRFRPYLSPNRVLLLTDYHLIILADGVPNWRGESQSPYQIEQHYFPRQHVQALNYEWTDDLTWVTISLGTAAAHHDIRLPLSPTNVDTLQAAVDDWLPQQPERVEQRL